MNFEILSFFDLSPAARFLGGHLRAIFRFRLFDWLSMLRSSLRDIPNEPLEARPCIGKQFDIFGFFL